MTLIVLKAKYWSAKTPDLGLFELGYECIEIVRKTPLPTGLRGIFAACPRPHLCDPESADEIAFFAH